MQNEEFTPPPEDLTKFVESFPNNGPMQLPVEGFPANPQGAPQEEGLGHPDWVLPLGVLAAMYAPAEAAVTTAWQYGRALLTGGVAEEGAVLARGVVATTGLGASTEAPAAESASPNDQFTQQFQQAADDAAANAGLTLGTLQLMGGGNFTPDLTNLTAEQAIQTEQTIQQNFFTLPSSGSWNNVTFTDAQAASTGYGFVVGNYNLMVNPSTILADTGADAGFNTLSGLSVAEPAAVTTSEISTEPLVYAPAPAVQSYGAGDIGVPSTYASPLPDYLQGSGIDADVTGSKFSIKADIPLGGLISTLLGSQDVNQPLEPGYTGEIPSATSTAQDVPQTYTGTAASNGDTSSDLGPVGGGGTPPVPPPPPSPPASPPPVSPPPPPTTTTFSFLPVVLDLNHKGVHITPLSSSNMFFDMKNDGYEQHTAWAGAGDGVLVYDPGGGPVTEPDQVEFTLWDPAAKNDMQALEQVFDTNHDGVLNASDADWSDFYVLVTNANGTTTLETMAEAGVTSINLEPNAYRQVFADGSSIDGETTFTSSNGTVGTAATVSFAHSNVDYTVQQTVTQNADGSTTVTNSAYNPDGTLAQTIATTTSANGLDKTTVTSNGSGIVLDTQTDDTVINADGSTTETLTDVNGAGVLLDRTVTTTSASTGTAPDGSPVETVTIDRDPTGAGYTAQQEIDTYNADGSTSMTISDLTRNGTLIDQTVSSVSASGLTRTVQTDSTGDGIFDLTETDATVVNADGSQTETVTDTNSDSSMRDQTVTNTSANGLNITKSIDSTGNGIFNLITTDATVNNADGSTTETQTNYANNGAMLSQTVTTVSADGLTTTTQTDSTGDGTFDTTTTDQTVVDAAGDRTRTITTTSANGTVNSQQIIVKNANGVTGSTSDYTNFGSGLVLTQSETKALNSSGALVDTVTTYGSNGVETGQTVTTTSANGLVTTTQVDPSGAGVYDYTTTSTTVENANGSSTVTVAETAANGSLINETVITTSAAGLDITTQEDNTGALSSGNPVFDTTVTDDTVDNSNGSITETITTASANGTLLGEQIINTSADRSTVTTTTENGDGQTVQVDTNVTAPTGVNTDTLANYAPNGTLVNETVTTTSANGLDITTQEDNTGALSSGNPVFDTTITDDTVINANGSQTETVTTASANGTQTSQTVTTTSANGLSKTTTVNIDGNVDYTTTDNTVYNVDGSTAETVTKTSANGTVLSSTVTTTSGNGLDITTQEDNTGALSGGNPVFDTTITDDTVINADGSTTETITTTSANGTVTSQQVIVTDADGVRGSTSDYVNFGSGLVLTQSETKTLNSSGALVDTVTTYGSNGAETGQTVTTTSADGLVTTTQVDLSGAGVYDYATTSTTVYNADGSSTATKSVTAANGSLINEIVTTTSANGLDITTQEDNTGALSSGNPVFDTIVTDDTAINANGSTTETITTTSANGTLLGEKIISTSSDQLTVTTTTENGDGQTIQVDTKTTAANGSVTDTLANYAPNGTLINETVTTTSANGLSITTQEDNAGALNGGNPVFDTTITDDTVINANGSQTETVTTTSANGAQTGQTVTTTSANGLSKTTTVNIDGNIDYTTTDDTVINAGGSTTETVTQTSENGSVIGSTVTTTSGNGLSVTTQTQNSVEDVIQTDVTVLNADGSTTETVTDTIRATERCAIRR